MIPCFLTSFLSSPETTSMSTQTQTPAPIHEPFPAWIEDAEEELAFFAGFHDGDGCVTADARMFTHQATDNRQVLDRLHTMFKGALGPKPEDKRGNRAPALLWRLRLDESIAYAKAIAPYSLQSRKRGDLELVAAFRDSGISRAGFSARIKAERQTADVEIDYDAVRARMTLGQIDAYLAGFFFADGHAGLTAESVTATRLTFSQKKENAAILRFAERHLGRGGIHDPKTQSASNLTDYAGSKDLAALFAPLLPPGSAKRETVELVRDVAEDDSEATRARLTELAGNKPSAIARRKKMKGCISKHSVGGVVIGWYARFPPHRRGFTATAKTPEENRALAEACLAEWVRERDESFAVATDPTV